MGKQSLFSHATSEDSLVEKGYVVNFFRGVLGMRVVPKDSEPIPQHTVVPLPHSPAPCLGSKGQ